MTNEQKNQIAQLRQSGYGYANIADALGLTKNQVSAYCRRAGLTGTKAAVGTTNVPASNCCRNCGKPLMQVAGACQVLLGLLPHPLVEYASGRCG